MPSGDHYGSLSPSDRAYEAYDPAQERAELVRELDGWSVYARGANRVGYFRGPGCKRRALARQSELNARLAARRR
jgi:hypothetical protein